MNLQLAFTAETVSARMDEILACFKRGAKITVIVRTPGNDAADFLMTSDSLDEAITLLERRKAAGPEPVEPVDPPQVLVPKR